MVLYAFMMSTREREQSEVNLFSFSYSKVSKSSFSCILSEKSDFVSVGL